MDVQKPDWLVELEIAGYYSNSRYIEGVGWCALERMLFTWALLVGLHEGGRLYRYCFAKQEDALLSLETWDGNGDAPGNWIVRKGLGLDLLNPTFCKE